MEFCKVFNPDLQQEVADNLDRAMFGKAPMLCTIDATYGEGSATQWIVPQLYNLCVTVGVKVKLDDTQLAELAQMIRKEFGYLKATELMLDNATAGLSMTAASLGAAMVRVHNVAASRQILDVFDTSFYAFANL